MSIDRRVFNCRGPDHPNVRFESPCPERWEALTSTHDPYKRHCSTCDRAVFRVINIIDAKLRVSQGECIAVPAWMAERPSQTPPLQAVRGMLLPSNEINEPYAEQLEEALRRGPP